VAVEQAGPVAILRRLPELQLLMIARNFRRPWNVPVPDLAWLLITKQQVSTNIYTLEFPETSP